MKKQRVFEFCKEGLELVVGTSMMATAFALFFVPNQIAPGGVSGIATLLNVFFQWPVGLVSFIINVPLYIIGWRQAGKAFMVKSLIATAIFSLVLDNLPIPASWMQTVGGDVFLSTLFGGLLCGAGLGLVFRAGASTGGTDLVAAVIHRKFPSISAAWVLFAIDMLVVVAAAITLEPRLALYALIAVFLSAKTTDAVQMGLQSEKCCMIISDQREQIIMAVQAQLGRGVTSLHGRGEFSGKETDVIMCVVSRQELTTLKRIVHAADPSAFFIIYEVNEVLGEGFVGYDGKRLPRTPGAMSPQWSKQDPE